LFTTAHKIFTHDSRDMKHLDDHSIDLVITSPPYPMIEMWDNQFCSIDPSIKDYLNAADGPKAFELMHRILDDVWAELFRVMKNGAFACVNIGDAVRTINSKFQLYPNHSRIQGKFVEIGFDVLPLILWRKQTNAPNKFMGSGMLPAGAYVTLEHEYILIFRKGGKREFKTAAQKEKRMQSSFFWEERNTWFSDLWDLKGARQDTNNRNMRKRSAAFPLMLPFRLINMYSLSGDAVLDPFMGTGTTILAAIAAARNSIGFELESSFSQYLCEIIQEDISALRKVNVDRIKDHLDFISRCKDRGQELKHLNSYFGFPVMTAQEKELKLSFVKEIDELQSNLFQASYFNDHQIKNIRPEEMSLDSFDPESFIQNTIAFEPE